MVDSETAYTGPALALALQKLERNGEALEMGRRKQIADVVSGGSYCWQIAFTLYFGVGKADRADRIEVRWPSGEKQSWTNVTVNQTVLITEGRDKLGQAPFSGSGAR